MNFLSHHTGRTTPNKLCLEGEDHLGAQDGIAVVGQLQVQLEVALGKIKARKRKVSQGVDCVCWKLSRPPLSSKRTSVNQDGTLGGSLGSSTVSFRDTWTGEEKKNQ